MEGNKVTNEERKETEKRGVKITKETQKDAVIIIRRQQAKHRREGETKN